MVITCPANGSGGIYTDQTGGLTNGQQYLVSAWAKVVSGTPRFGLYVHDGASANSVSGALSTPSGVDGWQQYSVVFTATSTTNIRVHLSFGTDGVSAANGTLLVDNVQIKPLYNTTITSGIKNYDLVQVSPANTTTTTTTTTSISSLSANTQYCYTVKARDNALNVGSVFPTSGTVCKYTRATQVTSFTTDAATNCEKINLAWSGGAKTSVRIFLHTNSFQYLYWYWVVLSAFWTHWWKPPIIIPSM